MIKESNLLLGGLVSVIILLLIMTLVFSPTKVQADTTETSIVSTRGNFNLTTGDLTPGHNSTSYNPTADIPGFNFKPGQCPTEAILFVHDFNMTNVRAVYDFNLLFDSSLSYREDKIPLVGFSWDSNATAFSIASKIAGENGPKLAKFIFDYKSKCPNMKIRLVAHSLGARVVLEAISTLENNNNWKKKGFNLSSVHLLGAEVDNTAVSMGSSAFGQSIEDQVCEFHNKYDPHDKILASFYPSNSGGQTALGLNGATDGATLPSSYEQEDVEFQISRDTNGDGINDVSFLGENHNGYLGVKNSIGFLANDGAVGKIIQDWKRQVFSIGCLKNLSSNSGRSAFQHMAISGSNVYVVWEDTTPGNYEIFFRKSTNSGTSFGNTTNLSSNPGYSRLPQIAASGSNVFVVWEDSNGVLLRKSSDNGSSFGGIVNLSGPNLGAHEPRISVSGNQVYVVWTEGFIFGHTFFSTSSDIGTTFSPKVQLDEKSGYGHIPEIASVGNNVYVVWNNYTADSRTGFQEDKDIIFRKSGDSGKTFGPEINLSKNPASSRFPQITASGDNVYVGWNDIRFVVAREFFATFGDVSLKKSSDDGKTFGDTINLKDDFNTPYDLKLLSSGSKLYVLWTDSYHDSARDVKFRTSTNNGTTFVPNLSGPALDLSNNRGDSIFPDIATADNHVYVVWSDNSTASVVSRAGYDTYFKQSDDSGMNFGFTINLSNHTIGDSWTTSLVASNNHVYMAWTKFGPRTDVFFGSGSTDADADICSDVDMTIPLKVNINSNGEFYTAERASSGPLGGSIFRGEPEFSQLVLVDPNRTDPGLKFKDEEPGDFSRNATYSGDDHYMQPNALGPFEKLKHLVQKEWHGTVKLRVSDAYDSMQEHTRPRDYHYDGRAIDMTTDPKDDGKIPRLTWLGHCAGFSWAFNEGNHYHGSVQGFPGGNTAFLYLSSSITQDNPPFSYFLVKDPTGKRVGAFANGTIVNDLHVPNALNSGPFREARNEFSDHLHKVVATEKTDASNSKYTIIITDPMDNNDNYTITLSAGSDPQFHVDLEFGLPDGRISEATLNGVATPGRPISFQVTLSLDGISKIVPFYPANNPPVANAGDNGTVDEGTFVTLNGSASHDPDGDALQYKWRQVAGPTVIISGYNSTNPTFTSPLVNSDTALTFQLIVSDGIHESPAANVTVVVKNNPLAPSPPPNNTPISNAGGDRVVQGERLVTLNGSASYDPDGTPVYYKWKQLAGPVVTLSESTVVNPTFLSALVDTDTVFTFQLVVSDGIASSAPSMVNITVKSLQPSGNHPPIAKVGENQTANGGTLVTLNGTGSSDPDGDLITYKWTQISGPLVELQSANTASPIFLTPSVNQDVQIRFQLIVNDGIVDSTPSFVSILDKSSPGTSGGLQFLFGVPSDRFPLPNVKDVAIDNNGNIYASVLTFSDRTSKFVSQLAKLNPSGTELWRITFGANNCLIAGRCSDVTIGPFEEGETLDGDKSQNGIAIDNLNNIYIADTFNNVIQKYDKDGNFVLKFGSKGNGDGQFNYPEGIAVDSLGNVYVADTLNSRIQKFDSNGNFLSKFGSFGSADGQFNAARDVKVGSDGSIYVADGRTFLNGAVTTGGYRIEKFNSTGDFILKFTTFTDPVEIGVDKSGDIYTATGCGEEIDKYSQDGKNILSVGFAGGTPKQGLFYCPQGVALDKDGFVYVADTLNNRIQKLRFNPLPSTPTLDFVADYGTFGFTENHFNFPIYTAIDSRGNIYVIDQSSQQLQKFDSTGKFVGWLGGCSSGTNCDIAGGHSKGFTCTDSTCIPSGSVFSYLGGLSGDGIAVDNLDNLYISDGPVIHKFDNSGNFLFDFNTNGTTLGGVAVDSSGNVYATISPATYSIQKLDPSGKSLLIFGTAGSADGQFNFPKALAVNAHGNIYVADTLNSRIQVFDNNGNFITKFGTFGKGEGQLFQPYGVVVDDSNNTYVSDSWNDRVQEFDKSGNSLSTFGTMGSGKGQFHFTRGIALQHSTGNLLVTDAFNQRVQVFGFGTLEKSPIANNQTVSTNQNSPLLITLTGSDPNLDAITFDVDGGPINGILSPVVSIGPSTAQLTYTPNQNFVGMDSFTFKVNDGIMDSNTAQVNIIVNASNHIITPIANAGPSQIVNETTIVTLNGTGSTDSNGGKLTYNWTQLAGPTVTLSNPTDVSPIFLTPPVTTDTNLTFQLIVNNGALDSAPSTVNILVKNVPQPNLSPEAVAGPDQVVSEGVVVSLNGSDSTDPDGDPITYKWMQSSGPQVILSGNNIALPTFTAPQISNTSATVSFELVVNDGIVDSSPAVVNIVIVKNSTSPLPQPNNVIIVDSDIVRLLQVIPDNIYLTNYLLDSAPSIEILSINPINGTINAAVGNNVTFVVECLDQRKDDTVILSSSPLPVGASLSPTISAGIGGIANGTFSWTPNAAGTANVGFTCTTNNGLSTAYSLLFEVSSLKPPVGTPGKVTGGGSQLNKGTNFGFNVQSSDGKTFKGELEYQDKSAYINLHSVDMKFLSVDPSGTKATFTGTATVNGKSGFTFNVQVEDNGKPGSNDKFSITINEIPGGYTKSGTLTKGNIQIHK